MVPDFYRLAHPFGEPHNHTWAASIIYYLPSALVTLWLFHRVIKLPMISLAPRRIQAWLLAQSPDFAFRPFARFMVILVSAYAGIITHFVWDSFTHNGGWALRRLHLDVTRIDYSVHRSIYVADLLQDISSVGGILLLAFFLYRVLSQHLEQPTTRKGELPVMPVLGVRKFMLVIVGVLFALCPACVMFMRDPQYWMHNERRQFVGFAVISGMDIVLLEILVFSLLWQFRSRSFTTSSPSELQS
jgi:hypothetical protein